MSIKKHSYLALLLFAAVLSTAATSARLSTHTSQLAYNFSLPDQHGKIHQLFDYKSKIVLINFC